MIQYGEMPALIPGGRSPSQDLHGVNRSKSRSGWGGIMMSSARVIPHNDGAGAIDSVGEGCQLPASVSGFGSMKRSDNAGLARRQGLQ